MDREPEELQFLSLVGIYRSSGKLLLSSRRLFSQILLSLVLPLSFLFLAHVHISHLLFSHIRRNEFELERAAPDSPAESRLLSRLSADWTAFLLFKALYLVFLLVFSLLSTSAVVYTVASLFSAKPVDFRKIFTVVPKVWRRLMVTFLWAFLLLFLYNAAALAVVVIILVITRESTFGLVVAVALFLAYLAGLVWISVVWHVASVVSVLEDARGIAAMRKSRALTAHQGEDVDRGGDILQAQYPLRGDRVRVQEAGGGEGRGARRGGADRVRVLVSCGDVRGGDVRAGGADGGVFRVQELPPREHRQEQLVGAPRGLFGGLRAAQGIKGCAARALLQQHYYSSSLI